MSDLRYRVINQTGSQASEMDLGLRSYMMKVYGYMFMGLSFTGFMAFAVTRIPELQQLLFAIDATGRYVPSGFTWFLLFAQVGAVLFLSLRINHLQSNTARLIFFAYALLMGLSLSSVFLVYTGASLSRVFFITSSVFGAMTLYGYVTKRDLTGFGSFLFMGLIGIVLASLVNIFLKSSMMDFIVSVLGVLIFTGLTAYDTQRIKEIYYENDSGEVQSKKAVMGALALYLDFINLFLHLLRFLGDRRN
ncbi:MAG: Bax inhibitor-1 family protein [Alphaproteobacteria bacterium]